MRYIHTTGVHVSSSSSSSSSTVFQYLATGEGGGLSKVVVEARPSIERDK